MIKYLSDMDKKIFNSPGWLAQKLALDTLYYLMHII